MPQDEASISERRDISKDRESGEAFDRIKGFRRYKGQVPPSGALALPLSAARQPIPPAGPSVAPWGRELRREKPIAKHSILTITRVPIGPNRELNPKTLPLSLQHPGF
jgi:hypothetical protein